MECAKLLVAIKPGDIAMFRFLLEAHDNLAIFTVLERKTALLKLVYPFSFENKIQSVLADISRTIPVACMRWPINPMRNLAK